MSKATFRSLPLSEEQVATYCDEQLAWAQIRFAATLPDFMQQLVERAMDRSESCQKCEGNGRIAGRQCPNCRGSGQVEIPGDRWAIRTLLEITGVLRGRSDGTGSL